MIPFLPSLKTDFSYGVIPVLETAPGDRRYLLVQHKAGHWGFPKGHPVTGETPVETALRELAEETGITECRLLEKPAFIEHYISEKKSGRKVFKTVTFYLGYVQTDHVTLPPDEVQACCWGNAQRTRDRITYQESKTLFDEVERFLHERPDS